jgi:hypothetical protein
MSTSAVLVVVVLIIIRLYPTLEVTLRLGH